MKYKTILIAILSVVGLNGAELDHEKEKLLDASAQDSIYHANFSRRFIPYIKLGPEVAGIGEQNNLMPGAGFGIRSESEKSAVDCSFSYAKMETKDGVEHENIFAPKLVYLRYLNAYSPSALFVGFGGAWALMKTHSTKKRSDEFNGLAGVASMGIEYNRSSRIRQIYQVDLHQPVIGLTPMEKYIMPVVEVSFALGF